MKTNRKATKGLIAAWIIAIALLAVSFGIIAFEFISGTELPDAAKRILGIVALIALPVVVFTSIRLRYIRSAQV